MLGLVLATGGAAGFLGAAITGPLVTQYGIGIGLIGGQTAVLVGLLLVPVAGLLRELAFPLLVAGQVLMGAGIRVFSINQISLRQAITASEVLGRVNATRRFLVFGIQPVGAICGGVLGSTLGLTPALLIGGCVQFLSLAVLLWSPVRSLRASTA